MNLILYKKKNKNTLVSYTNCTRIIDDSTFSSNKETDPKYLFCGERCEIIPKN